MNINEKVRVIKDEIMEEAETKKDELISSEKEKWEEKYAQFQENLEMKLEEKRKEYEQRAEWKREQIISRAVLKKKKKIQTRLNELINKFMEELYQRLLDFRAEEKTDYRDFIKRIILESVSILNGNKLIIGLNESDHQFFQDILGELAEKYPQKEFVLKEESSDITGGVIVQTVSGEEMVDYSLKSILDNYREDVALSLQERLL